MVALDVSDVTVRFGGIVALDGVSFTVDRGQVCGLIGPNGAGKTTLFNCVTRVYQPEAGAISFEGVDLLSLAPHRVSSAGVARTFQNLGIFPSLTVLENVMLNAHHRTRTGFAGAILKGPGGRREESALRRDCLQILGELDLHGYADVLPTGLPYGTLKRIELARALAARPRLLLLDEPAGGLTHAEVDELGDLVLRLRDEHDLTVLLVEHHMRMVMRISDHVVVMDSGRKLIEGPPALVQKSDEVAEAYLGAPR